MQRLGTLTTLVARELQRRLEEVGVHATLVHLQAGETGGVSREEVFIPDDADRDLAVRVFREVEQSQSELKCWRCGYDLRGHAGCDRCPECGSAVRTRKPDTRCPHCGESTPAGFEVCWSCGRGLTPDPDPT